MKYKTLDFSKPIQLYINGIWIDVLPTYHEGLNILVKNIDKKGRLPLIDYKVVDLYWHFTVAEGKQIKNTEGKLSLLDKIKFRLRSLL